MLTPKKKGFDTIIIVGPYRIPIERTAFQQWEAELMQEAGFTEAARKTEILRRLGYEQN